jgi:hypothetical protein
MSKVHKGGSGSDPPFLCIGISEILSREGQHGSHMGAIGNVVVNTVVGMLTRKAMVSARSANGKR